MYKKTKKSEWTHYKYKKLVPLYRDRLKITYCENCGGTFGLNFHHLNRRSKGGENIPENIMLLCQECHHKADNAKGYVEFNEMLKMKAKDRYWLL